MSEWRRTDEQGQPVFDDDRLLALALGLDDDPELEAAAGRDDALRRRLDEMRADVAAVGGRLATAVPAPDDSYADPTAARWSGLHEYFAQPPTKAARSTATRWLRVLAPAVAVAVALAVGVGIIASQTGPGGGTSATSGGAATSVEKTRQPSEAFGSADDGKDGSSTSGQVRDLETQRRRSLAKQAEAFAVVVVAKAADVVGDVQRFTVVRELKGRAPDVLRLGVVTKPARIGALHVLFLDPVAGPASPAPSSLATPQAGDASTPNPSASPSPEETPAVAGSASPGPSVPPTAGPSPAVFPRPVAFRFAGARAIVRRLPAGFDLTTLRLP